MDCKTNKWLVPLTAFACFLFASVTYCQRPNYADSKKPWAEGSAMTTNCAHSCKCLPSHLELVVDCSNGNLDVIPNDLPPMTSALDLAGNNLHKLTNLLSEYELLTMLRVSENRINDISPWTFHKLRHLTHLDLSGNQLSRIDGTTFKGLRSLLQLDLSQNIIETFDLSNCCPHLENLHFGVNRLVHIPANAFNGTPKMQTLNLSGNLFQSLSAFSSSFLPLHHLSHLDLSDNTLEAVKENVFKGNEKLTELVLSSCTLKSIAYNAFPSSLRILDLSGNLLMHLPSDAFNSLYHLESLSIGSNLFTHIKAKHLRSLTHLKTFILNGCDHGDREFLIAADAFHSLDRLEQVNLTHCQGLRTIEANTFRFLPELKILNFHSSGLKKILRDSADWSNLKWFDISGTPLDCEGCELAWLATLLNLPERKDYPEARCSTPTHLKGRLLTSLEISGDFQGCEYEYAPTSIPEIEVTEKKYMLTVILSTSLVFLILLLLFFGVVCYFKNRGHNRCVSGRRKLKRRTNLNKADIIKLDTATMSATVEYMNVKRHLVNEIGSLRSYQDEEEDAFENIYEVPLGPTSKANTFPDVKLTSL